MNDSIEPILEVHPTSKPVTPHCHYCGSELTAFYYFCLACGTPHRPVESVLTPARPVTLTDGERVERLAPHVKNTFWTFFTVLIGTAIISRLAFPSDRMDLAIFLNDAAIFVMTCVFVVRYRPSLMAQLRHFGFNHWASWVGLLILPLLLTINYFYNGFLFDSGVEDGLRIDVLRDSMQPSTLIVLFCIMPALTEEIAFRGLIQHWLQSALTPSKAILLASCLFALLHFSVLSFPYLLLVGLLLGWTKWKTGSLYPAMLIHFLHNFVVIEIFPLLS